MTTPPQPPPDPHNPGQYPPYGPPPHGPHPTSGASVGVLIGLMFVGLFVYSVLNTVIGFFIFIAAMDAGGANIPYVAAGTAVLALIGLGVGIGLVFIQRSWTRGLGIGLMIGWSLWSILSAGFCTGLNPGLYA
jgi:hypothetical protein